MKPPSINRLWLQGEVSSHPVTKPMNARLSITTFELSMVESWVDGDTGETKERHNRIMVEVLGRDAQRVAKEARLGAWVSLEGYLRSEVFKGENVIKVRTLSIKIWEANSGDARTRERIRAPDR